MKPAKESPSVLRARAKRTASAEVYQLNPSSTPPEAIPYDEATLTTLENIGQLWGGRDEIAGWFKCTSETVYNFFKRHPDAEARWQRGWQVGKTSLRRDQRALAKTNSAMAIFLGKNYLGQKDVVETAPDRGDGQSARATLARRMAGMRTALSRAGDSK